MRFLLTICLLAPLAVASYDPIASHPDVQGNDFVSGRCVCRRAVKDSREFPCANVTLTLVDSQGREVGRLRTSDGEFVFPVQKDEQYGVRLVSTNYSLPSVPHLHRGDHVVLHLVQK